MNKTHRFAAAIALKDRSQQSSYSNKLCLAGFEKDTLPLSTNVMSLTPQPMSVLATAHPKVPAPRSKHLVVANNSVFRFGHNLHLINRTFKSTACSMIIFVFITALASRMFGPGFPLSFGCHPKIFGRAVSSNTSQFILSILSIYLCLEMRHKATECSTQETTRLLKKNNQRKKKKKGK